MGCAHGVATRGETCCELTECNDLDVALASETSYEFLDWPPVANVLCVVLDNDRHLRPTGSVRAAPDIAQHLAHLKRIQGREIRHLDAPRGCGGRLRVVRIVRPHLRAVTRNVTRACDGYFV